jgi:hypothetical protein
MYGEVREMTEKPLNEEIRFYLVKKRDNNIVCYAKQITKKQFERFDNDCYDNQSDNPSHRL